MNEFLKKKKKAGIDQSRDEQTVYTFIQRHRARGVRAYVYAPGVRLRLSSDYHCTGLTIVFAQKVEK